MRTYAFSAEAARRPLDITYRYNQRRAGGRRFRTEVFFISSKRNKKKGFRNALTNRLFDGVDGIRRFGRFCCESFLFSTANSAIYTSIPGAIRHLLSRLRVSHRDPPVDW